MAQAKDTDKNAPPGAFLLHASVVSLDGQGLLIRGRSGSGKSGLALQLMALGAELVADDRVWVTPTPRGLIAQAPASLRGLIEARGIGILNADPADPCPIRLVVDLDQTETERVPPRRDISLHGLVFPLFYRVSSDYFPSSLIQLLAKGRNA